MLRPAVSELIGKNENYYELVINVSKRAREIADDLYKDGKVLDEKPVKTAVEELYERRRRASTTGSTSNSDDFDF